MKIILTFFIIAFAAVGVKAQVAPNLLQNHVNDTRLSTLKIDTNLSKLTKPVTPGTLFDVPAMASSPLLSVQSNNVVYSRMPVAKLNSTDNMPVAKLSPKGQTLDVARITVIDPLKQTLVNAKN